MYVGLRRYQTILKRFLDKLHNPDFVVFLGDAVYGTRDSLRLRDQLAEWKEITDTIAHTIPIYMVMGNHEANCFHRNYDGAEIFAQEFVQPENGPSGYKELVYSFDYANCHFVILNSDVYNNPSRIDEVQRGWLIDDLTAKRRFHNFLFQHEEAWPPYEPYLYSSLADYPEERDSFWEILYKYRVEADLCGHIHLYNRDFFKRTDILDSVKNVRQIICGSSGGPLVKGYGGDFYHYILWRVHKDTIGVEVYNERGTLQDEFGWIATMGADEKRPISHHKVSLHAIPNPIKGEIELSYLLSYDSKLRLYLYDVMGRLVKIFEKGDEDKGWHKDRLDVSHIPSGVYFLFFEDEHSKTIISKKVCILR